MGGKGRNDLVAFWGIRGQTRCWFYRGEKCHTRCWFLKVPLVKFIKMKFLTVNQGFVQGFPNLSLSNCLIVLFSPQNSRLFTRHSLRFPTAGRTSAEARISCNLRGLRCEDLICLLSDDGSLYDKLEDENKEEKNSSLLPLLAV